MLTGVTIGALLSFGLTWWREHLREKAARQALARAFYQEILYLGIQCCGGCAEMKKHQENPRDIPVHILRGFILPEPTIYKGSAPQLGLLPDHLRGNLVAFYNSLAFSRNDIKHWAGERSEVIIPPDHIQIFAKRWFQLCRLAADALEELCRFLDLAAATVPSANVDDLVRLLREKAGPAKGKASDD